MIQEVAVVTVKMSGGQRQENHFPFLISHLRNQVRVRFRVISWILQHPINEYDPPNHSKRH